MQIVIVSGMSGAGKSYALQALEDTGYYCIDNLPSQLMGDLLQAPQIQHHSHLAIGIDIRGGLSSLREIPQTLERIRRQYPKTRLLYLYAHPDVIRQRYNETRRQHPLMHEEPGLERAISLEENLLGELAIHADWRIDTSHSNVYELSRLLKTQLQHPFTSECSILLQSFGFKHATPADSDFIFDVRSLPNPYWVPELRNLSGRDQRIIEWLEQQPQVKQLLDSLCQFLDVWLADLHNSKRAYLTISIGCTGGRHRSVYMAECLYEHLRKSIQNHPMRIRHNELNYIR